MIKYKPMWNSKHQIAPSLLAANGGILAEEVRSLERAGADRLHLDIMDGHFVPNLSFGPEILQALRPTTSLSIDVHLMVMEPEKWVHPFQKAGAQSLTIHVETQPQKPLLEKIRGLGIQMGLAINPDTPLEALLPFLDDVDLILVMTVEPGFGGQSFRQDQVEKIRDLRVAIDKRDIKIHADGGITSENARILLQNGVQVLVAGSAILKAPCYAEAIEALR